MSGSATTVILAINCMINCEVAATIRSIFFSEMLIESPPNPIFLIYCIKIQFFGLSLTLYYFFNIISFDGKQNCMGVGMCLFFNVHIVKFGWNYFSYSDLF